MPAAKVRLLDRRHQFTADLLAAFAALEVAVTVVPDGVTGSFAAWPSGRDEPASRPVPRNEEESA